MGFRWWRCIRCPLFPGREAMVRDEMKGGDTVSERQLDADVIIIGGGPAGSALGTYLARDGHKTMIIEKDIHPRDHVGESLTPSTNLIFKELGILDKINERGF